MDFEAPVDAWYVYLGVALTSMVFAGIALSLPSTPPPDAQQAANSIDGATGSEYTASATYEHDAATVTVDHETITMANDHGESHASVSYGSVVPVNGYDRLENITKGQSVDAAFEAEFNDPHQDGTAALFDEVDEANAENTGQELHANGELIARTISVEADDAVGIDVRATNNDAFEADLADNADDLEPWEIDIPGELRVRTHGEPVGYAELEIDGEPILNDLDVEDTDGFVDAVADTFTGLTCSGVGVFCSDTPEVEPFDETIGQVDDLDAHAPVVDLIDDDFDDLDGDEDVVDIWTGTYDLSVTVSGPSFDDCEGVVTNSDEWTDLCSPEQAASDFEDRHWHDQRGTHHYVTLVIV